VRTQRARERCRERIRALCDEPADLFAVRTAIVDVLRAAVGFDRWCWPVTDPESGIGTSAIGDHDYWDRLPRLLLLDQRVEEPNALPPLAGAQALSGATGGRYDRALRWTDVFGPLGIGDEIRVPLRDRHGLWGCLDLMRDAGDPPFSPEDLELLDALAPALAAVTRRAAAANAIGQGLAFPAPAGVLVLDEDLDVRAATPGARAWLDQLLMPTRSFADLAAPAAVYSVASRVLARRAGYSPFGPARARVQSVTGAWALVEGDQLDGARDGMVAVTVRAATPTEVLDLRFLAHDLTPREREVVALLLQGADTATVAATLFLSPHTVQDHLKSVFGKVGVRTRKELVAELSGTRAAS
jgi:DNA-binding CsgD family transcriptional regulator